jgi:transcription elongation factor Elf1
MGKRKAAKKERKVEKTKTLGVFDCPVCCEKDCIKIRL